MTVPSIARGYEGFGGRAAEFTSDSVPWWPAREEAPAGAPNIIVMLVDDLGFSDLGPFGSEIPTPHIDRLAGDGWVFTNYRTAPMCSPARAALLTGINPHRAGFGFVAHTDPGYPGFAGELPASAPTLAESLRAGGYATFMVGKWHLTVESRLHDGADKSSWPIQRGFDRYFGSMDGFTSVHHPHRLIRDNSVVDVPEFPDDYFLTDELTKEALSMLRQLRSSDATKPFFLYYAHTSVHGPIHAKAEDIGHFRGKYEAGWNAIREERFARQRALGIVPSEATLPSGAQADDDRIPSWAELSAAERELFERHMEAYAAAVSEVDQSVGKLVDYLEQTGQRENTIIVLTSDNGGTAEGGPHGTRSYFAQFAQEAGLPEDWVRDVPLDPNNIGGPQVFNQYPAGWARVSNTPFRSFKSSTYEGGIHAPLVVSWPGSSLTERGVRGQFAFVSDLTPTLLDLVGVSALSERDGSAALVPDGTSLVPVLATPDAPARTHQYFECLGARAMIEDHWKAVAPTAPSRQDGIEGGRWELYHLGEDPTEMRDRSAEHPELTRHLASRWRGEAWRNAVFPLDDDGTLHSTRPDSELMLREPVVVPAFAPPLERFRSARLTVLSSFAIEIDVTLNSESSGVIVAHGDQGGGYLFGVENGAALLCYNAYGAMHRARTDAPTAGRQQFLLMMQELPGLRYRMLLESGGQTLCQIDNVPMLMGMAPFTGISVGYDYGSPVDWELYEQHRSFRFTGGSIHAVRYVPGARSPHDQTVIRAVERATAAIAD